MIRHFIETLKPGERSRLIGLSKEYHASRIDADHIFGVVEVDGEQAKRIDALEDVTLLPLFKHRKLSDSKNPHAGKKEKHVQALQAHGVNPEDTPDEVVEKMFEKLGNPGLLK